jgi:uncharacterized protein YjbI with pentapeptide repeats
MISFVYSFDRSIIQRWLASNSQEGNIMASTVNGYTIEPGVDLTNADLSGVDLTGISLL